MNRKIIEKLLEFLVESNKAKKREIGFAEAKTIISVGLGILGMDANDILGFVKSPNERKIRRVRGSQAWFRKMYNEGWKYAGNFEYEGLLNNGFVVMERELPNPILDAIKDELNALLKDDESSKYIHIPDPEKLRGSPEIQNIEERMDNTHKSLKAMGYKEDEIKTYHHPTIPTSVKEPKEGFESDVNDFMIDAKKEMKTDEQLFFDETGKQAIWHGKPTKAFKEWKEGLDAN